MYMFLNEVKLNLRMRIMLLTLVSLSKNYTVFVENHNLWRFICTQWLYIMRFYRFIPPDLTDFFIQIHLYTAAKYLH